MSYTQNWYWYMYIWYWMLQVIICICLIFFTQRLIVCLEESLYIHNIRDMKVLHTIRDTPPNPHGLCALSINNDNCFLAYPGSNQIGEVQIFDTINLVCKLSCLIFNKNEYCIFVLWISLLNLFSAIPSFSKPCRLQWIIFPLNFRWILDLLKMWSWSIDCWLSLCDNFEYHTFLLFWDIKTILNIYTY